MKIPYRFVFFIRHVRFFLLFALFLSLAIYLYAQRNDLFTRLQPPVQGVVGTLNIDSSVGGATNFNQVGIGTTNPASILHLLKNGGGGPVISFTDDNSNTVTGSIANTNDGQSNRDLIFSAWKTGTGLVENMRIKGGSGNVGIATNNPVATLHIQKPGWSGSLFGYGETGNVYIRPGTGSGLVGFDLGTVYFTPPGGVGIGTLTPANNGLTVRSDSQPIMVGGATGGSYNRNFGGVSWDVQNARDVAILIGQADASIYAGGHRLFVRGDTGYVGIGTVTPGHKLEVNGHYIGIVNAETNSGTWRLGAVNGVVGAYSSGLTAIRGDGGLRLAGRGLDMSSAGDINISTAGYIYTQGEIYPGNPNRNTTQLSYYLAGNYGGYGLYTNAAFYSSSSITAGGGLVSAGVLSAYGNSYASKTTVAKFYNTDVWNGSGARILIGPYSDGYMASIESAGYPYSNYASDLWLRPRKSDSSLGNGIYISSIDYAQTGGEFYPGNPNRNGLQGSYWIAGNYGGYGMYTNNSMYAAEFDAWELRTVTGGSQGILYMTTVSCSLTGYCGSYYPTLKSSGNCIYFDAANTYTGYICNSTGFVDVSDEKTKTNIKNIDYALDKVLQIDGITFAWKDGRDGYKEHIGVTAQNVEKVAPQLVFEPTKGTKGVNYGALSALTIEAIKEINNVLDVSEATSLKSPAIKVDASGTSHILGIIVEKIQATVIETKKLIVAGVDVLERLNTLTRENQEQEKEIDALKLQIQQLKAK